MDLQFIHVAQLYETVAAFAILILLVTQILTGYNQLWGHITKMRIKDRDQELKWIKTTDDGDQKVKNAEAEKSAIQSLRREMSMYQNKGNQESQYEKNQKQQEEKDSISNLLGELSSTQKSILLFYIEYGNLISQHFPLILSILVLGILTSSTKIFTLACFFSYLLASLMFDFLHLEERLKQQYKKGIVLRRVVKILSACFIIAIFINYWANGEFS